MGTDATELAELQSRQADLLYNQGRIELVAAAISAIVLFAIGWESIKPAYLLAWAAAIVVVIVVRLIATQRYLHGPPDTATAGTWVKKFAFGAIVLGLMFGALGALIAKSAALQHVGITLFCLAALSTMMLAAYNGVLFPSAGFSVAALLPPAAIVATGTLPGNTLIAAMVVLYAVLLSMISQRLQKNALRVIALDIEATHMRSHLDVRRDQIEKLTVGMKTNAEKRQKAELELRRTSADLGLLKGKAHALSETLSRVSPFCPVTGIPNRRSFDEHLGLEWRRAMRERKPLSLMMCEIDQIDLYTETYGSQSGDALVKRIAKLAGAVGKRAGDLACRFSDSRFAIILPSCDNRNAARIAEAFRKRVEGQRIPHAGARADEVVTVHVGVVSIIPTSNMRPSTLLERIDTAMYEAKFQGGNRVVVYRTLAKLRLERWNPKSDGQLTQEAMIQKLMIWGFEAKRTVLPSGTVLPDKTSETEIVCGVLTGALRITIEGQSMELKSGDCLFVPGGTTFSAEVSGSQAVAYYEAVKAA
jgi:diguanylate cyclase (GGDEF)-like protein